MTAKGQFEGEIKAARERLRALSERVEACPEPERGAIAAAIDETAAMIEGLSRTGQRLAAEEVRDGHLARLQTLIGVSREVLAAATVEDLLRRVLEAARELTDASAGLAAYHLEEGRFRAWVCARDDGVAPCPGEADFCPSRRRLFEHVMEHGRVRLTAEDLKALKAEWGASAACPLRAMLGGRLSCGEGHSGGVLIVANRREGEFSEEDEALFEQLTGLASLGLRHIEARQEAERRAAEMEGIFAAMIEPVVIFDAEGVPVKANPAVAAVTGFEIAGHRLEPREQAEVRARLNVRDSGGRPVPIEANPSRRALRGERVINERYLYNDAVGREQVALVSASPIRDGERVVGAVLVVNDVTERERLMGRMEQERLLLEQVIRQMPAGLVIAEAPSGRILTFNDQADRIWTRPLGRAASIEEYVIYEGFHADGRRYAPEEWPLARSLRAGEVVTDEEVAVRRADGSQGVILISSAPVVDREGHITAGVVTFIDITDRKAMEEELRRSRDDLDRRVHERTQELARANASLQEEIQERIRAGQALKESEERFTLFMRHMPGLAFIKDHGGVILYLNDYLEKAYGTKPQDVIGKTDFDLWPPEIAAKMREDEKWVMDTGQVKETVDKISRGGRQVFYLSIKFPMYREGLPPLVGGVAVDISDLRRAEDALRHSEERYRSLVEMSPDGIMVAVDGRITFANPSGAAILQAESGEQLAGMNLMEVVPPDMPEEALARLRDAVEMGRGMSLRELKLRRLDGSPVEVELAAVPIMDRDAAAVQIVFRDITQRREAEERIRSYRLQLRSLASELTISEERERHRIAQVVHDTIGQTLAVAKIMLSESLGADMPDERERRIREASSLVDESIAHARSLTLDLTNAALYVLGLEAALTTLAERTAERSGIQVRYTDDGKAKPVSDDVRVLVYQGVRELLNNVVKHARATHATIETRREGDTMCVRVRDDGAGLDPARIWRNMGRGAGVGLFSLRERLGHFGGRLELRGRPGQGTSVTMVVPLQETRTGGDGR